MLLDVHVQHQRRDALGELVSNTSWNSHNYYAVLENIGLHHGFTICSVSLHLFAVCNSCVKQCFNTSGLNYWTLICNIELEQHWEIQCRTKA